MARTDDLPRAPIDTPGVSFTATGVADALELQKLDAAIDSAIRAGEAGPLHVLGYGEISLVLGWPSADPAVAVKRLPAFRDEAQIERYASVLRRYLDELERRGIRVVPTDLRWLEAANGLHAYLVQPFCTRDALLTRILTRAPEARGAALLSTLATHVAQTVDDRVGLDGQAANWVVEGDGLACLDVSTPMLRGADGRQQLDLAPFLSMYPWALRAPLARVAQGVMAQYHDPRAVLVDVGSNLIKERLEQWLPALLAAANAVVEPAISEREVRRYFARDKKFWLLMQRLRRADRAWQRHVRRRPYPFLLPPPYHYGPPELPEES